MKRFLIFIVLMIGISLFLTLRASTSDTTKKAIQPFFSIGLTNQYVWRGVSFDNKPNIQPSLGFDFGKFSAGTFYSTNFVGNYSEFDVFASYKINPFKLGITDYYISTLLDTVDIHYFNNKNHYIVADLTFLNPGNIPFSFMVSTMLKSGTEKNMYSTYAEVRYFYRNTEFFFGVLKGNSVFYDNNKETIVPINIGVLYNKKFVINDKLEIPTTAQVCVNPQKKSVYLIFNVTF